LFSSLAIFFFLDFFFGAFKSIIHDFCFAVCLLLVFWRDYLGGFESRAFVVELEVAGAL
jgi:hypothetical protein